MIYDVEARVYFGRLGEMSSDQKVSASDFFTRRESIYTKIVEMNVLLLINFRIRNESVGVAEKYKELLFQ
ncbi:hypothetical protein QE369_004580 [Agrobacterium larrymoorei]|uniref:Uncharacterized protein n=1 Tax=Agrobacterium larrymoorei TaxID=160699 RepID=A0AAJ2BCU5_9HYPH|nr:hypothetical protein [Agrobacterium larrymoorei]MDR6104383.1 hypothetical protein [Agrobacterium larrymoorei]